MKKEVDNKYFQMVYKVVLYIEENYKKDLSLGELAKISGFSKFHFHRIFKFVVGSSLGNYIKRAKMSSSTRKFMNLESITKIALQSGYDTPASYTKAFKNVFGKTPKEYFQNIIKENKKNKIMEPIKIENFEAVDILYVRKEGKYSEAAGQAFEVLMKFVYTQKIKFKKNLMGENAMVFGIGHDDPSITESSKLRYDACVTWDDKTVKPQGEISTKTIPAGKYAIFLHKGSYDGLEKTYREIMVWIMKNEIDLRDYPMFEKYLNRDPRRTKEENLRTEIFVPLV
jgi:AraC family transcriptional regulator